MELTQHDLQAIESLKTLAKNNGLDIKGGKITRTSSRFCFGVEHGDYNGTELFGIGTDRFIWLAYKPNHSDTIRLFSGNFPDDGLVKFRIASTSKPKPGTEMHSWARFPLGVDYILKRQGFKLTTGFDAVIYGNIPGGGMSRSASLTINLIISALEASGIAIDDKLTIVDMAQAVENDYIGSPCGQLDQIMILFAREGMGTHYNPAKRTVTYVPLGKDAADFRIVSLDTGTIRPGLEKSTYKVRRAECENLVQLAQKAGFEISCLADIKDDRLYNKIKDTFIAQYPHLCSRMKYIYDAQNRFENLLIAWKKGDIQTVGSIFRLDGIGLRDDYKISGPELETMCDIVRTIPGSLGERMLGGGDKGAAGAIIRADAVDSLTAAVNTAYPRSCPDFAQKYAIHTLNIVDGVKIFPKPPL